MPQDSFSYLIYRDVATVYAQNGVNGNIDFSSADAAAVIQYAINALPQGGYIFIKEGTYELSNKLTITTGSITLEGQGRGRTILSMTAALPPATEILFINAPTDSGINHVALRNFSLKGPGRINNTLQGIKLSKVYRSTIEGVYVSDLGGHGIEWITGFYNRILHCHVENVGRSDLAISLHDGIYLHNTVNASEVLHTHVRQCARAALHVELATDGVAIIGGSYQSSIYGIQLGQMNNTHLTDVYLEENQQDLYVDPGAGNWMDFLTVKGCNSAGGNATVDSVYLDRVRNAVFLGGRCGVHYK
ncbi:MAG: hypothetical protein HYR55_11915 [Acidobacteria bacterium]|nr:hypothetical protein [Acidobacteriota bacterium]MBI3655873.1 hypothetical protein [Acidobacteriota bacterium]